MLLLKACQVKVKKVFSRTTYMFYSPSLRSLAISLSGYFHHISYRMEWLAIAISKSHRFNMSLTRLKLDGFAFASLARFVYVARSVPHRETLIALGSTRHRIPIKWKESFSQSTESQFLFKNKRDINSIFFEKIRQLSSRRQPSPLAFQAFEWGKRGENLSRFRRTSFFHELAPYRLSKRKRAFKKAERKSLSSLDLFPFLENIYHHQWVLELSFRISCNKSIREFFPLRVQCG